MVLMHVSSECVEFGVENFSRFSQGLVGNGMTACVGTSPLNDAKHVLHLLTAMISEIHTRESKPRRSICAVTTVNAVCRFKYRPDQRSGARR
jgi:hypothetical protein